MPDWLHQDVGQYLYQEGAVQKTRRNHFQQQQQHGSIVEIKMMMPTMVAIEQRNHGSNAHPAESAAPGWEGGCGSTLRSKENSRSC
mmetsp:Transcript_26142/g.72934  ORF Transcript_26142/g.72934 Transcript_26142/m.72934 type:complete len:86 (+) Transcript_26142:56-313(+)